MTLTRSVSRSLTSFVITGATVLEWGGFPWVTVADDPLGCVARGTREVLLHLDKMKSVLESGDDEY